MGLSREEYIEIGAAYPTDRVVEWAGALTKLARQNLERLGRRGVTPAFLGDIEAGVRTVRELEGRQERGKKELPASTADVERARRETLDWWGEARQIVKVEFGGDPDAQARFRTGVKIGHSTPKLAREIEFLLPLLRRHREQIEWLGMNDEFLRRGEEALGRLREADAKQETTRKTLPAQTAELYFRKGQVYDQVRKLVRIGRLEFAREPERAKAFAYEVLRRGRRARRKSG